MDKDLSKFNITGFFDSSTGAYDLLVEVPFLNLLIFIILIFTAIIGFNLLARIIWK